MLAGHFTDHAQSGSFPGLFHIAEAFFLQTLEGIGGGSWLVSAATQQGSAGLFNGKGCFHQLFPAFNGAGAGHNGQSTWPNGGIAKGDYGILRVEFPVGKLVGFGYGHNLVYAFADFKIDPLKLGFIAYYPDDGYLVTVGKMNLKSLVFNLMGNPLNSFFGSAWFHNNNHR